MQDFPETAYRTQIERGFRWLRFDRTLELEFRDARLTDVRLRARAMGGRRPARAEGRQI